MPRLLKPMEPFKNDILLLSNLTHNNGRALLDGGGDHARATGGYLTGMQPRKTTLDIKTGISCDQVIAQQIGGQTRFPSLEAWYRRRAAGRELRLGLLLLLHQ